MGATAVLSPAIRAVVERNDASEEDVFLEIITHGTPKVEIVRALVERNGGLSEEDPDVFISIGKDDQIANIRASELDGLIENLTRAVAKARRCGVLPLAATPEEVIRLRDVREARLGAVRGDGLAGSRKVCED